MFFHLYYDCVFQTLLSSNNPPALVTTTSSTRSLSLGHCTCLRTKPAPNTVHVVWHGQTSFFKILLPCINLPFVTTKVYMVVYILNLCSEQPFKCIFVCQLNLLQLQNVMKIRQRNMAKHRLQSITALHDLIEDRLCVRSNVRPCLHILYMLSSPQ